MSQSSTYVVRRQLMLFYLVGIGLLLAVLVVSFTVPSLPSWTIPCALLLSTLLGGGFFFRRVPRLHPAIESQLSDLAGRGVLSDIRLQAVHEHDPVGAGWNNLRIYLNACGGLMAVRDAADEALKQSSATGAVTLMDSLPDGVIVTDDRMQIRRENQPVRALLGIAESREVVGKNLADILPLGSDKNATIFQEQTAEPFRPVTFELMRGDSVEEGVLRLARTPSTDEISGSLRQVWSIRDVTQQKLSERARDEFVSTATHELRTPLANILAYSETLAVDDLDITEQKEFLNIVHTEAQRLSRFVDELLDISKMEAGAMAMHMAETDMLRVLQEVVSKVEPQMEGNGLTFEKRIPPKLPKFDLDKEKFVAALVNLLGNAAKYTPSGGSVRFDVREQDGHLALSVEDTGFGISEEELPKLFDKFFRSDDERVRNVSGSGLGLAFTHEIVKRLGGEMTVESELDRGSCFTISLPMPVTVG